MYDVSPAMELMSVRSDDFTLGIFLNLSVPPMGGTPGPKMRKTLPLSPSSLDPTFFLHRPDSVRAQMSMTAPVCDYSRPMAKLCRLKFKPERFIRLGSTVIFERETFQRQTLDKRQRLLQEAAADQTANNVLIAKKVLKYRNLYN